MTRGLTGSGRKFYLLSMEKRRGVFLFFGAIRGPDA
jgi:hypothetical protein